MHCLRIYARIHSSDTAVVGAGPCLTSLDKTTISFFVMLGKTFSLFGAPTRQVAQLQILLFLMFRFNELYPKTSVWGFVAHLLIYPPASLMKNKKGETK
jgi:hypothetical protein